MNFKDYLNEKLQLSQYRQIVKMWKQSGVRQKFDHVFDNKDRLYEPYEGEDEVEGTEEKSQANKDMWYILDWAKNDFSELNYDIQNYNKGLGINKTTKKTLKLTKILDAIKKKYFEEDKIKPTAKYAHMMIKIDSVKKAFINDKSRLKAGNLLICYSRHAYDIAGMSTDRGWTSCMALPGDKEKPEGGQYAHYVPTEITAGTIIAYLIKEDDKNIKNPLGRMLIKPYVNQVNNEIMMAACTGGYGTVPEDMIQQVTKWTEKLNKKVGFGVFQFAGTEDTHVKKYKIGNYPKTIEDFKKTFKSVDVFTNVFQLLGKDIHDKFIKSHWNDTDEFKIAEVGPSKVYLYDIKAMMNNFTDEDYLDAFKHGFDLADDIGYELTKISRNLANSSDYNEVRSMITNIRIIAYMIHEHKYSTEPELQSKYKFNLWLHSNQMHSEKNMNLFEPMKKYYEKLKKIMRK